MRFLLLLSLVGPLRAQLPPRFAMDPPGPRIEKPAQPAHFLESVGRRAAILGTEDGTFEAWINPIQLLRDFRLAVYFDGAVEPSDLAELAETVTVSPGRVTITHSHGAFTIRQTWVAALDEPALLILLAIDTNRPLRLRASFIPEMKPMWPAAFGGQSSEWDEAEHAFVLTEGLRRFSLLAGSPLFSTHSEQIGHQLPGERVLAEMQLTPELCRDHLIPIVLAGSRAAYRAALQSVEATVRTSDAYYAAFDARTMHLETPDPALNRAFAWAKFAVEKGWACNEGVGCGLVAGYGRSGASQRPGFAWYFGGDALMNSWSIVDYGDFSRARDLLAFLRDHQRRDGKMEHELTQSAALLDWSQYPYGYYHADTTPLYIVSMGYYLAASGDADFLRASWDSVERAYQYCLTALDDDGLLSNRKAGAGAVETGALSGRVANDVYLQGVWLAALDQYIRLAALAGRSPGNAGERRTQARATLERWFADSPATLSFARLIDGSLYAAQSAWQSLALALGGLDPDRAARAAANLYRPELTTDWGARLFATDSPNYDPLSYDDGSVWPFVTGFAVLAGYAQHQPGGALRHLHGTAALDGFSAAGFIPEYMSGERAQALPRAVPHQLFSSSAVIHPAVAGMLGMESDASRKAVRIAPHIPQGWTVRFDHYRVADTMLSGTLTRERGEFRCSLTIHGEPLDVTLSPAFAKGALVSAAPDGAQVNAGSSDTHVTVRFSHARSVEAVIRVNESAEPAPVLPGIAPGAGH